MEIALAELRTTTSLPAITKRAMNVAQDEMYVDITDTEQYLLTLLTRQKTVAPLLKQLVLRQKTVIGFFTICTSAFLEVGRKLNEENPRR